MVSVTVDVRPLVSDFVTATGTPGDPGAIQEQNLLAQTALSVAGSTQESVMSLFSRVGQHVTVVMVATPAVSWQALWYPLGQMRPGEK